MIAQYGTAYRDGTLSLTAFTDPATNAAVTAATVNKFGGVVITTTTTANAQTIASPTATATKKEFIVANNDTSTHAVTVNSVVIAVGEAQKFLWDGSAWLTLEAVSASQISFTPTGNIVAINVQTAIAENDTDKIAHAEFTAADEIMVGTGAGTHGQVTLAASQFLAKGAAGAVGNKTATEARAILNVEDAAAADQTAAEVPIVDTGNIITATDVEGALQEHRTAINLNTAKATNVPTALSTGTVDGTSYAITSDGGADDVVLAQADTTNAGVLSAAKWNEIVANTAKSTNVPTALSVGTNTTTVLAITSDGGVDDVTIPLASTTLTGVINSATFDAIGLNTAKVTNVSTALSMGTIGVAAIAITSDGGADDVTLPAATNAAAGVATAAQITKLEGIETGAVAPAVYEKTTSATITAAEVSGLNTLNNNGAGAEVILTWLALVTGQEAMFYVNDAQYLQIKAPAATTIRNLAVTTAANGYIRSNTVGNWVKIKAMPDGLVVMGIGGIWNYDE